MTTAYTSLLGLALPVTGELSGTWGDTVNTAITSLLDTAVAGTTSITTDADITLTTTTGASNQARQAIILWNPASGTTTRNITAPAQSKMYTVINASGGTQSIVIRGVGPTTGVTVLKGESALVAWNGSDFVKVSSIGGSLTLLDLTVTGNTILGDAAADTLTVNATSTFNAPVSFAGQVKLPSTGRSAAAALTPTNPAFLYGVASTYTDTASSGTLAPVASFYGLAQPTLSTSNVTTYTSAATLYIANAPTTGGSATITNPYALYVAAGTTYLAGNVGIGTSSPATKLQIDKSSQTPGDTTPSGALLITNTAAGDGCIEIGSGSSVLGYLQVRNRLSATYYDLAINPNGGNVGIGTSSPTTRLTISGTETINTATDATAGLIVKTFGTSGGIQPIANFQRSDAAINMQIGYNGANGDSFFGTTTNHNLYFISNNTERMRIDSSGNVGIGTTSPSTYVSGGGLAVQGLYGTSSAAFSIYNNSASSASNIAKIDFKVNNTFSNGSPCASILALNPDAAGNNAGALVFSTSANGTDTTPTERMRIDKAGNVGIGTSAPGYRLDVASGDTTASIGYAMRIRSNATATAAAIQFTNSAASAQNGLIGCTDTGTMTIQSDGASSLLAFRTNGAERARIDSSGNLLVGGTTILNGFGAEDVTELFFAGGGGGYCAINTKTANAALYISRTSSSTTGNLINFSSNAVTVGSISYNGTLTVYATTSDYRLKTVIGPVVDAGTRIDSLQPVEYTWNSNGQRTRGFLAHKFQEVYASSVTGTKDAVDADGKPIHQEMQASSTEVIADLVAEIQSLRKRLTALEST